MQINELGQNRSRVSISFSRAEFKMSIKTILSVIGVDHGEEDLVAAAELARQASAHLNVAVISRVPPPAVGDLAGQTYSTYSFIWEEEDARLNARTADMRALLSSRGYGEDVQPIFCLSGVVEDEVAERAAYADVTVIGGNLLADSDLFKYVLDGTLFKSPAPVLLVGNGNATLSPKKVLLAWNASVEAGVAVRQSMAFLEQAHDVHVVLVDPVATMRGIGEQPGADIATFLSRHGVKVTVEVLASGGADPAVVLQRHAVDIGAELIVMGAYGHTRMRERIFGGTTQTMLGNVTIPVLMAR
jgi:nucleotide-binding universal stress UspA family protein